MRSILVSIVVPVYNQKRERFERCIDSICNQTYQRIEAIVVDDGSSEENYLIEMEVCSKDKRIILLRQENAGSGAARNNGIKNANGEYILFLDSDDMLSEYAIEDAINCLAKEEADLVVGYIHKERETEWSNHFTNYKQINYIKLDTESEINEYINHIFGYHSKRFDRTDRYFCDGPVAKLCKRELLEQSTFDTQKFWGEDTIWNLKFTKLCQKIIISDNIWYYAFANQDSQTHIFRPNCKYEFKYRINQEKEIMNSLWPDCKKGLYTQVWTSMHYVFACYLIHKKNQDCIRKKYKDYLECNEEPVYQEMLKGIVFDQENSFAKKVIKKIIRYFSIHGPKLLAYYGWILALSYKHGER